MSVRLLARPLLDGGWAVALSLLQGTALRTTAFLDCWVRLRVSDIYIQTPTEVLSALLSDQMLEGKVIDYTDSGDDVKCFVVVRVPALLPLLVVPLAKISMIESQHG